MSIDYNRWLVGACAAYMALVASNFGTFWRSGLFVIALVCVAAIAYDWHRGRGERPPLPPASILAPLLAWFAWSSLSWLWSVHRAYTLHEIKAEVLQPAVLIAAFYLGARTVGDFRRIATGVLVAIAFLGAAACTMLLLSQGWDPLSMHDSNGHYSTFIVLATPWLLLVVAPGPTGFGGGRGLLVTAAALLALLLVSARITETRIVWLALFGVLAVTLGIVAWRWPRVLRRISWRGYALLLLVLIVLGVAFLKALEERAQTRYPPNTTIEATLERDPRLTLWTHLADKFESRPLTGYGFGRHILAAELVRELGDPLLTHAHNAFASQLLQTGVPGMAAFVALLLGAGWRFVGYVRSRDDGLALVGLVGTCVLVAFVLKNLTDDFMFGSNSRELWCMLATLFGYGERLRAARNAGMTLAPSREDVTVERSTPARRA